MTLHDFLEDLRPPGFISIHAYLQPNPEIGAALEDLRQRLRDVSRRAQPTSPSLARPSARPGLPPVPGCRPVYGNHAPTELSNGVLECGSLKAASGAEGPARVRSVEDQPR